MGTRSVEEKVNFGKSHDEDDLITEGSYLLSDNNARKYSTGIHLGERMGHKQCSSN